MLAIVSAEGQKQFSSNVGSLPIHDGAGTRISTSSDLKGFLGKLESSDLMVVTLSNGELLYFEIAKKSRNGALDARCEGERFRITVPKDLEHIELEDINIENVGHWPPLSDAWIRSCPGLKDALKELRKRREQNGNLPSQRLSRAAIVSLDKVSSFSALENEVEERPSLWCDGTGPGDAVLSSEESALLPAGEITSLLKGFRGIVLVQTLFPAVEDEVLVPLLRPYVLALLSNAAQTKGVAIKESVAAGGAVKSLILYSKQQPFKAWAQHLVNIGVQASLVADSPYYKLLIGKMLGYKEENIIHHIEVGWIISIVLWLDNNRDNKTEF